MRVLNGKISKAGEFTVTVTENEDDFNALRAQVLALFESTCSRECSTTQRIFEDEAGARYLGEIKETFQKALNKKDVSNFVTKTNVPKNKTLVRVFPNATTPKEQWNKTGYFISKSSIISSDLENITLYPESTSLSTDLDRFSVPRTPGYDVLDDVFPVASTMQKDLMPVKKIIMDGTIENLGDVSLKMEKLIFKPVLGNVRADDIGISESYYEKIDQDTDDQRPGRRFYILKRKGSDKFLSAGVCFRKPSTNLMTLDMICGVKDGGNGLALMDAIIEDIGSHDTDVSGMYLTAANFGLVPLYMGRGFKMTKDASKPETYSSDGGLREDAIEQMLSEEIMAKATDDWKAEVLKSLETTTKLLENKLKEGKPDFIEFVNNHIGPNAGCIGALDPRIAAVAGFQYDAGLPMSFQFTSTRGAEYPDGFESKWELVVDQPAARAPPFWVGRIDRRLVLRYGVRSY